MILIHTHKITERFSYVVDLIFSQMLGVHFRLTTSESDFSNFPGPKISYGNKPQTDGVFIKADGLLDKTDISEIRPVVGHWAEFPVLFSSESPDAALPFDPFAASFYMVSRYEEYLPFAGDRHGRFPANESIAYKSGFLEIPVVHHWVNMLRTELLKKYSSLKFNPPLFRFTPTIDIDHAWCYLGRPLKRTLGGFGRSLMNGRFGEASDRLRVLAGNLKDPYDNYQFLEEVHHDHPENLRYFILYADYGGDDNNVTISSSSFHKLLKRLDLHQRVGIHPSLTSNEDFSVLQSEISELSLVLQRNITLSRQHFLKLAFPNTYHALMQSAILHDYSMGYASHPGFRAGISVPYPFFDLSVNKPASLIIHPVTLMDVTFKDYLRLNPDDSLSAISLLVQKVKDVNGELVTIWHNESLGDQGRWKGWREVYTEMVKMASAQ